jgi:DNA-binding transcriptional MerR regulator
MVYENKDGQDKNIRGKALYFGTSQVADMLGISDSRVRYYTNVFRDILHIEISNKQRRYTQADIDKMKFMIELKEDGMTLKQIQEYCQEVDFQDSKEIQIKENNPLGIQAIAKALLEQQAILISEMKQDIIDTVISEINKSLNSQNDQFNEMKDNLSKEVAITVEDTVQRQMLESSKEIKDQIQNDLADVGNKIVEENKKMANDFKYITLEELKSQQQIGFFSKLFGKKK